MTWLIIEPKGECTVSQKIANVTRGCWRWIGFVKAVNSWGFGFRKSALREQLFFSKFWTKDILFLEHDEKKLLYIFEFKWYIFLSMERIRKIFYNFLIFLGSGYQSWLILGYRQNNRDIWLYKVFREFWFLNLSWFFRYQAEINWQRTRIFILIWENP